MESGPGSIAVLLLSTAHMLVHAVLSLLCVGGPVTSQPHQCPSSHLCPLVPLLSFLPCQLPHLHLENPGSSACVRGCPCPAAAAAPPVPYRAARTPQCRWPAVPHVLALRAFVTPLPPQTACPPVPHFSLTFTSVLIAEALMFVEH